MPFIQPTRVVGSPQSEALSKPVTRGDNAKRWLASILLTAIFCAIEITRSLRVGALALPTQYDDISYYLTGAEYLQIFHGQGIIGILKTYLANPPHAPLSTGLAFLGFSLFGVHSWAGAVADSIVFLFFVRWFMGVSAALPILQSVLLAIALFGFPFVTATIMSFRPDMFCSLFLACGTVFIVARREWLTRWQDQIIAGLFLAAALWSKPTVFHLSIALFGAAIFLSSLALLLRRNFAIPIRAGLTTLATGILLSVPYYAFAGRRVIDYIWTTVFGAEASIWVQPIPLRENLLFYLTGYYGKISLGAWLYVAILAGASAMFTLWRNDRLLFNRALLVGCLVVITYLAVTIPTFKGPHGFPFAAVVLVSTVLSIIVLILKLRREAGWAICIALLVFSCAQFTWPTEPARSDYAASRWSMVKQMVDAVGNETTGKTFLLTTSGVYLNYSIMAFEYYRAGLLPPASDNTQTVADMEEQRRRIGAADIVFALTPEFTEVFPHLPTASKEMRAQIIKAVEDSHRFKLKSRIVDAFAGGGAALIYVRSAEDFSDFSGIEGLRPIEGPYPQWGMPRVRWGWGSQTKLVAEGPAGARSKLSLEARTVGLPNQILTVSVNGEVKARTPLNDAFAPIEADFEFNQQGRAEIVLGYSVSSENAVLYKRMALER